MMNILILPSVAKITLIGIVKDEPSFPEQSKSLSRHAVMFMDLRQALRKIKRFMIKRKADWKLNKGKLGEEFFQLRADKFIHAVIIVDMQESASDKVIPEV